jgi:hypothetical protein
MLKDKIEHYFNRYPNLKILFLFDAGQEYREDFLQLDLPDYRKAEYNYNDFFLKVYLNGDWLNDKVVLYLPMKQPINKEELQGFPLLDLLFANKSMQPDDSIGDFMEKYGLQRHQRSLAAKYLNELRYKAAQEVLKPYLTATAFNEENIIHGLLSFFLKFSQVESWEAIIMRLLALTTTANEAEWNKVCKKVTEYTLDDFLLNKINKLTGIMLTNWSLVYAKELLDRIKYNLYVQDVGEPHAHDPYKVYWCKSTTVIGSLNLFHERLLTHARFGEEWLGVLENNHSGIHEKRLVEVYGAAGNFHYYGPRLKWEILGVAFQMQPKDADVILSVVDRLMMDASSPLFQNALLFIQHTFRSIHTIASISSYILDSPQQYLSKYTLEWNKIDYHYRKAIWYYRFKIDFADVPLVLDWDKQLDALNEHYRMFLEKSNREWLKCWSSKGFEIESLEAIPQYNFYQKEIKPLDQKVAVIISDGLRYEAGLELLEALNADAKNVAQARYMVASVPSKTNVGMANLLPGKQYEFQNGDIRVDNLDTAFSEKRERILKTAEPDSVVVKYADLDKKGQKEGRDLLKAKVVYIYHNKIDATGHSTESDTFSAVEDTIGQLTKFIKKLHGSYNVSKVIVTADHGFLYNDYVIQEREKEKGSGLESFISDSRFEISYKNDKPSLGYSFPLKNTTKFSESLFVIIPNSVNRYSGTGRGNQYVHGGASLQELVVPVIESSRKREEVSELVTPSLVTKDLKVVSNVLKFILIQEEPVNASVKERTIMVGLYKDSQLVSNEKEIELNKTSGNPTDRVFQIELHLVDHGKMETQYKLKVFDKADSNRLNALLEVDVKNQTLIQTDF